MRSIDIIWLERSRPQPIGHFEYRYDVYDMGSRNWTSVGSRESGLRTRQNTTDSTRQRSLWHSVQSSGWRTRHVCVGRRRRFCSYVWFETFRAFDNHIRRPTTSPTTSSRVEQTGPQLFGHLCDGCIRSHNTRRTRPVHSSRPT